MTDSSDLYEYRLETIDSSNGLFMLATFTTAALLSAGLTTTFMSPDLYKDAETVVYTIVCGIGTLFIWFGLIPFAPKNNPERFYFGQHGFQFESCLYSCTASFCLPVDKVRRISLSRENTLELTDNLGNTFHFSQVRYSLQSERELAECFPHALA